MLWDIFCRVIDNHGDLGVCWRLACNLAQRGETARLWVGAPSGSGRSELAWMAPRGHPGVQVSGWHADSSFAPPGDVVIEAFGCELPRSVVLAMAARSRAPRWINLEYLTAESYAQRAHGLPSPVLAGPGSGLVKHFFYPGFTARSGGLLREPDLLQRQQAFDRAAWLRSIGIDAGERRLVSLFCYEPVALAELLEQLGHAAEPTRLLVTAGRATVAVQAQRARAGAAADGPDSSLAVTYLPLLTQHDYDHLLWSCDFNFVRGEDSLVRALWAGRPFAWQLYPQHDDAHHRKLDAFLAWLQAPLSLRRLHQAWNGITPGLPALDVAGWQPCIQAARAGLLAQDDLATRLLRFASS
jgi:uncharacterized repeat protein (TIGR03837 family)